MNWLARGIVVALAGSMLAAPASLSSDSIRLLCDGTTSYYEKNLIDAPIRDVVLVIDFVSRIVRGMPFSGDLHISQVDEIAIALHSDAVFRDGDVGSVEGRIDRTSGRSYVMASRKSTPNQVIYLVDLNCRIGAQLF